MTRVTARFASLPGYVLVAPKAHLEHVVRDLDDAALAAGIRRALNG